MRARHSKFKTVFIFAVVMAWSLFGIAAVTIAWYFDFFGWHSRARWLFHASDYRTKVMSEPVEQNGSLRHLVWESWGFAGSGNTAVYLVFDPNDHLLYASNSGKPGKYPGIPCEVYRVRRLEKDWFIVRFYTGQDWNNCT